MSVLRRRAGKWSWRKRRMNSTPGAKRFPRLARTSTPAPAMECGADCDGSRRGRHFRESGKVTSGNSSVRTRSSGGLSPSEGTRPERRVRQALTQMGIHYRVNLKGVPGTPDIAFPRAKKAIFVHGCFWHLHPGCSGAWIPTPGRSKPYWAEKLIRNALRDQRVERELAALGWEVLVIWECETANPTALRTRLAAFLGGSPRSRGGSRSPHAPVARHGYRRRADSN